MVIVSLTVVMDFALSPDEATLFGFSATGSASGKNKDADLKDQRIGFEAGIGHGVGERTAWGEKEGVPPDHQSTATISRFTRQVNGFPGLLEIF
jgi:hypothetical protein